VWKVRSGAPWRDVPARYGSWQSVYTRFRRWALDGTFARMLAGVHADAHAAGDIDWLVSVDSTIVRAHQHAAGDGKRSGKGRAETPASRTPTRGQRRNRLTPSDDFAAD